MLIFPRSRGGGFLSWYDASMHTFFHGWRRKAGIFTLVMACVVMAGWLRSLFVFDLVGIHFGALHSLGIESKRQSLCVTWSEDTPAITTKTIIWLTLPPSIEGTDLPDDYKIGEFAWLINMDDEHPHGIIVAAPYWSVTIPLTILSAYLILWRPRKRI